MSKEHPNPYAELLHGKLVRLTTLQKEVPYTMPAVETYLLEDKVVGQFVLPFEGEDIVFWMPGVKKVHEAGLNEKIRVAQEELRQLSKVR